MNISKQSRLSIVSALKEALSNYKGGEENSVITDIHLQPKSDSGELIIFNDDDKELARTLIDEWIEYESDEFYTGLLKELCLIKPYSFVLVDDDKETVVELLLIDDEETLLLNDELLKGLDEELNDFLEKLLKD